MRCLTVLIAGSLLATPAAADLAPYPREERERRLAPATIDMQTLRWEIARRGHRCDEIVSAQPYRGPWVTQLSEQRMEGGIVRCMEGGAFFVALRRGERLYPGGRWRDDIAGVIVTRLR